MGNQYFAHTSSSARRASSGRGEALTPIHSAWRLDPATWHFRSFPTDSLACYNEGGGNP